MSQEDTHTVETPPGEQPWIWDCPACGTTLVGVPRSDCLEHMLSCGRPDSGYRGRVYLGVKTKYKQAVDRLRIVGYNE